MIPLADEWDAMLSRTEPMESQTVAEDIKPWTIKNVAPEHRNAAIAAADRADLLIGEWLGRAILSQVKIDQRTSVAAPGAATSGETPSTSLSEIEALIRIARDLASVPGVSDRTKGLPLSLIRERLKAAKGSDHG
jgi:hypothetical protein